MLVQKGGSDKNPVTPMSPRRLSAPDMRKNRPTISKSNNDVIKKEVRIF